MPIERLNAVLVVASQPTYLDQAEVWIDRLDRIGDGEEPQIFVYSAQNARATNLADVLSEMFDARTTTVEGSSLLAPGQEAIELSTTSAFAPAGSRARKETPVERSDPQGRSAGPAGAGGAQRARRTPISASSPTTPPIRWSSAPRRANTRRSARRSRSSTSCPSRC